MHHSFYANAKDFAQQTGYEELWRRHDGHLPTGKRVVMAQVENGVADPAQFEDKHIVFVPDHRPGKNAAGHENTTGRILYGFTGFLTWPRTAVKAGETRTVPIASRKG